MQRKERNRREKSVTATAMAAGWYGGGFAYSITFLMTFSRVYVYVSWEMQSFPF